MSALRWLQRHDAGYWALRRATRTAIVMPSLFAFGWKVLHNTQFATFAAFGSFALLLLVDFSGSRRERVEAISWLALTGGLLVCLGTLASRWAWLGACAMAVVAFVVLFSGIVSSVLASAATPLLISFVLPVATPAPVASIPDRVAGWALASLVAVGAVSVLWPAPPRDPLRGPSARCCRLIASRLRIDVAYLKGELSDPAERDAADEAATEAVAQLRAAFYATPNRPTGLGTAARMVVRLVDELGWLILVLDQRPPGAAGRPPREDVCAVKLAGADVLDRCADLLDGTSSSWDQLQIATTQLRDRIESMELQATRDLPGAPGSVDIRTIDTRTIDALEPAFRAQELGFAITEIARNTDRTVQADQRSWWQRLLGQQPDGIGGPLAAATERARAALRPQSVWLHNSLRGAAGLGLAVLLADLTGVQHSFWVVLGALSVLRSNALSTGQSVLRGLLGTVAGIAVGGLIIWGLGTDRTLLWVVLPLAVLFAGLAPAAISFAAGQAGFTVSLVILFNIISPVGYRVGLIRVEDVAIGCAVSLCVGLLFWPRGASATLGRALADAYQASVGYLRSAVSYGARRCERRLPAAPAPPVAEADAAAAASRRLDDAFREYLAEHGGKKLQLAEVTTLVTGVIAARLAADAVLDLWRREEGTTTGDRTAAGRELDAGAEHLFGWYRSFGTALRGTGALPAPQQRDADLDVRLVAAIRRDLTDHQGLGTPTAVRMIWTGDHLDAIRRLQGSLVGPARAIGSG